MAMLVGDPFGLVGVCIRCKGLVLEYVILEGKRDWEVGGIGVRREG